MDKVQLSERLKITSRFRPDRNLVLDAHLDLEFKKEGQEIQEKIEGIRFYFGVHQHHAVLTFGRIELRLIVVTRSLGASPVGGGTRKDPSLTHVVYFGKIRKYRNR
jgi:hypothetical protein